MKLTAIVLTLNESLNIIPCLNCLKFADEIIVVDSGSIDGTVTKTNDFRCVLEYHSFKNFADQRNWAMQKATGDWILFVDADERVSEELAKEIRSSIQDYILAIFEIPRVNYFFNKRMHFTGDYQTRLFPKGTVVWDGDVHEKVKTKLSRVRLNNPILHWGTRDLAHYWEKLALYVPLEVKKMGRKSTAFDFIKPPARFIKLYFIDGYLKDGFVGFQYSILSAYNEFLRYWSARAYE